MSVARDAPSRPGIRAVAADVRLALVFLTILPVAPGARARLDRAAAWFPAVGALVGAAAGGVRAATAGPIGRTPASVLAVGVLVVLTGALHLDGLADTADGLGSRAGRARRLEIMRDPAVGVFGALALIVWTLLMVTAVSPLAGTDGVRSLVAAAAIGRWMAVLQARLLPPARAEGLGASFAPRPMAVAVGGILTLALIPLCGVAPALTALAAAGVATALCSSLASRTLGGRTGDTLGTVVTLTEAVVCLTLLSFWRG